MKKISFHETTYQEGEKQDWVCAKCKEHSITTAGSAVTIRGRAYCAVCAVEKVLKQKESI